LPDELARLKAELVVIQWTGRGFIFSGIAASFTVAFRLAMDSTLSGLGSALFAVAGSVLAYGVGMIGGFMLRALRVDRLERIVNARSTPGADGVSSAGSAVAIPSMVTPIAERAQTAEDAEESVNKVVEVPHVVG
jgi:hypothetical protein